MIKLLSVAIVAGLLCESSQQTLAISKKAQPFRFSWYYPFHTLRWTRWYDRDNPSGTGDWELLSNLRKENPGQICSKPVQMEVRTVYGLSVAAAGDRIYKNHPTVGFVCRNRDQHKKKCNDYRVRFRCRFRHSFCSGGVRWTRWYDRDNPSGTGDWELLYHLRKENPGQICHKPLQMEVQTVSGLSVAATGDRIYKNDPTVGFVCRKRDQRKRKHKRRRKRKCNDYRVRFSCYHRFCGGGVCWTRWYDLDNPSGTGDWELLSALRKHYPGQICKQPLYIEAVTTDTMTPATKTGEIFYYYSPTVGFSCRRADQKWKRSCRDYKVRFGCPCKY